MRTRILTAILLLAAAISIFIYFFTSQNKIPTNPPVQPVTTVPPVTKYPIEYTATFEIYTNGTKRIFTDPKYHNLTPNLYIQSEAPNTVYVTGQAATWQDFFDTLPMSLTKNCLTTGTQQTFCNTQTHKLKFYINDVETPEALDLQINQGDFLKVIYSQ